MQVECTVTPQRGDDADGLHSSPRFAVFSLYAFRAVDIERDIQWKEKNGYEQSDLEKIAEMSAADKQSVPPPCSLTQPPPCSPVLYPPPFSAAAHGYVTKFITYGTIYSGNVPNAKLS